MVSYINYVDKKGERVVSILAPTVSNSKTKRGIRLSEIDIIQQILIS